MARGRIWFAVGLLLVSGFVAAGIGTNERVLGSPNLGIASAPAASPPLGVAGISITPNPATQGAPFSVSVSLSGGTPPFTYSWGPTPPGCAAGNTSGWQCTVGQTGQYSIGVNVKDSAGGQGSAFQSMNVTASGSRSGSSSGGNSSSGFNLSAFGPFLLYALIGGIVGFALLVILTVGVLMIAVILARRLPRPVRGAIVCGACHASAPAGSKFCPACAAPLSPTPPGAKVADAR